MSSVKKVAILVHNSVIGDARVRKQARTLVAAGHEVNIFGYSAADVDCPTTIEGGASLKIERVITRTTTMKIGLTVFGWAAGKKATQQIFGLFAWICFNTLVLGVIASALLAPILVPLFVFLAFMHALICLGAMAALTFKRPYIDEWIKVNWTYGAIAGSLAKNVVGKDYDVVHCHDIIAMMAGKIVKKKNPKITMIWDAHELYTEIDYKSPYTRKLIGTLITRISGHVDRMITISPSFVDIYAKRYPKLPKAEVVMNATRRPVSKDVNRALLRDAAGINDTQKIILFQGGIGAGRGVEILLQAAPHFPKHWSLVFMGRGALQGAVEEAGEAANAARPKGAPCISIIPPAPQEVLRDWTSGADLGVIPYENTSKNHLYCTPNKLWEYPNARVPILATDLIEMNKIITKNGTGMLLPRDFNADDIVSALTEITDEQLSQWQANCDTFNEVENWEKFEPNLLKAYA